MPDYFSAFLSGVTGEGTEFKDFQHASRLYVDELYALAPKQGFLYYVVFEINEKVLPTDGQWTNNRKREVGLLVKSCDLPKYSIEHEVLNQYNRKTYAQTKLTYQPVQITFHDDHANVTSALWQNYYTYYFADAASSTRQLTQKTFSTPPGYKDTKYEKNSSIFQHTDYGLNNDQDEPFFRAISIYQIYRGKFSSFTLINPLITQWDHDRLEQSVNSKLLENRMTVGYETVVYGLGNIKKDNPSGFATFHYDTTPSPLSVLGGGSASLSGPGGVMEGVSEIFGDLTSGPMSGSGIFQTAIKGANTLRNAKNLTGAAVASEGISLLTGAISGGKNPFSGLFGGGGGGSGGVGGDQGTAIAGGGSLNLFRIKKEKPTIATSAEVASPSSGQVSQSDVPTNGTSNGQNVAPPTNDITTTDPTEISAQVDAQNEAILNTQNQIVESQSMKGDFDRRLAAAADDEEYQSILNEQAASGYTDPVKLQENLTKQLADQEKLNVALQTANQNLNSPATISVDIPQIAVPSVEAVKFDTTINPDYKTIQNNINTSNGANWTKGTYV